MMAPHRPLLALGAALFCVALAPASSLAEEKETAAQKAALGQLERGVKELSSRLGAGAKRLGAVPTLASVVGGVRGATQSPEALFSWVQGQVAYEPYEGALRGAQGTLVGRRGNAVDQALLLQALYEAAGFEARLAWGQASGEQGLELLRRFSPESYLASKGELLKDPAYQQFLARHRRAAQAHVWVEVRGKPGGDFVAADPLLGQRVGGAAPVKRLGLGELPPGARSELRVKLEARLEDGQVVGLVEAGGPIWQFAQMPLHLHFEADGTLKGAVRPMLKLGEKMERGEYFPAASLASLTLTSRLRIGPTQYIIKQPLHQFQGERIFAQPTLPHFSMMVVPYWVGQETMGQVSAGALGQATGQLELLIKERGQRPLPVAGFRQAIHGLLDTYAQAIALSLLGHTDAGTRRLARTLGVEPVLERPRIVFVAMSTHGDVLHTEVDVHGYRVDAVSHRGVPQAAAQAFVTLQGRLENEVRSGVLGAHFAPVPYSTAGLFEAARAQKIPVVSLHEAQKAQFKKVFKGGKEAGAHLLALAAEGGDVMVVAKEPVEVSSQKRLGWWQIDPVYGSVVGEGWHGLFDLGVRGAVQGGDQVQVLGTLLTHLVSATGLWESALGAKADPAGMCRAARDVTQIAKVACATTRLNTLPTLEACLGGAAAAPKAGGKASGRPALPTQLSMGGDPLGLGGGGGAGPRGPGLTCQSAIWPMQCGAVVGQAFFSGELVATPKEEVAQDGPGRWARVRCK